nr:hypothetical protein [Tanacetum cinerariifolium]
MTDCGPIKSRVKHIFGGVVRAMISLDGSIVASLENVNDLLAVNTPPDDLIHTDFEQEGVVSKVMLHIFEEFILLLGRHPFYNKVPRMVVWKIDKPWGTLVTSKRNHVKCLERKCFIYFLWVKHILDGNSPEQSRLEIFFSKEIFEGGMIRIHNAFVQDEEFLDFEDSCSGFCPSITGSSLPQLHLRIKYP